MTRSEVRGRCRRPGRGEVVGGVCGVAVACAQGTLPRDGAVAAAALWVLMVLGGLTGAGVARAVAGRGRPSARAGGNLLVVAGMATVSMVAAMVWWQNRLSAAMGSPTVGVGWIAAAASAVAVCVVGALAPRVSVAALAMIAAAAAGFAPAAARAPDGVAGHGARFLSDAAAATSLRVYGELDDRAPGVRADELVARWRTVGGPRRSAVVVAVPTGSGWVDRDAVAGFERRLHSDVSVIALSYSDIPSWQAYVSGASARAGRSAVAVVAALDRDLRAHRDRKPPQLYLYGQSLGAVGAEAARSWAVAHGVTTCSTVLAGPPAGSVAPRAPRRVVLANSSDPVTRWSPALLWRPAPAWPGRPGLPRPPWFPVASFVQSTIDLLGALSFPAGHGHQYGTEQGDVAPLCRGDQAMSPRAAS